VGSKLKKKDYEELLEPLQIELNNLAHWLRHTGQRIAVLFEGRDTAGKGGAINTIAETLNPRQVRIVALAKPTETERTQWYFQRYVAHLPSAGELVMFDRSWYNRAGVEKVMGFCSDEEYQRFLAQVPAFEKLLADDGILLLKYWLGVNQEEQEERFAERASDPLKQWKLSPIDLEARKKYLEYTAARDAMFAATNTAYAPWYMVDFNDQRRGRLNLIRHLLERVPDKAVQQPSLVFPPLRAGAIMESYPSGVPAIRGPY
jgi:polyphosphate kinase